MSGMAEGHDRYARGLKPWALAQGVVHFSWRNLVEKVTAKKIDLTLMNIKKCSMFKKP